MNLLLGLDYGTGGAKTSIINDQGEWLRNEIGEERIFEISKNRLEDYPAIDTSAVGKYDAVIPRITGSANITGFHQFVQ